MHSLLDYVKIVAVPQLYVTIIWRPTKYRNTTPVAGMAVVEVQGRRQGALIIVYFKGSLPPWAGRKPRPRDAEAPDA